MKTINKYLVGILFIFGFLLLGANIASADQITENVTITVLPVVTTNAVSSTGQTTTTSGGNVISGENITSRGVVWILDPNNTEQLDFDNYDGDKSNGSGVGSFSVTVDELSPNKKYSIRAYATNSFGTGYGEKVSFNTLAPVIENYTITATAGVGGSITPNSSTVAKGSNVTLTVTPSSNEYMIDSVTGCGVSLMGNYSTTLIATVYNVQSSCTVNATFKKMTGSLTPSSSSCDIVAPNTTCSVNLNWNIINPIGSPTSITSSGRSNINVTSLLTTPQYGMQSVTVSEETRIFWLYNNGVQLAYAIVTGSKVASLDSCGLYSSSTPRLTEPTGTNACTKGTLNSNTPTDTTQAWNWSCGTVSNCSAPKYGCTQVNDSNYNPTGPSNDWGCAGTCSNGSLTYPLCPGNLLPIVNAGPDMNINLPTNSVSISGASASDSDGNIVKYEWSRGTYPVSPSITNGSTLTPTFSGMTSKGSYVFILTVTDNLGAKASDSMIVTVGESTTLSVVANPVNYKVPANNPVVSFSYTSSTSRGTASCRLVDSAKQYLNNWQTSGPIVFSAPNSAIENGYGYYIECKNNEDLNIEHAYSNLIIVKVVQPSVIANPFYEVIVGSTVPFTYTTSTIPSDIPTSNPKTECRLVDYEKNDLTGSSYQNNSPISYAVSSNIGSYGYYIKCRNKEVITATVFSDLITVNTLTATKGSLTPHNCVLILGEDSCNAKLDWKIEKHTSPITAITADTADVFYKEVTSTLATPQQGTIDVFVTTTPKTFYLYNNSDEFARAEVKALPAPTGTLSATPCTIPKDQDRCDTNITWQIDNPISGINTSTITVNGSSIGSYYELSSTNFPYSINPGETKIFNLYYNGLKIAGPVTPVAKCANSSLEWEDGKCKLKDPKINEFKATPETIFKDKSSTLSWELMEETITSCSIKSSTSSETVTMSSNNINGSVPVTPKINTTYTLECSGNGKTVSDTATVKVIDMTIKEN